MMPEGETKLVADPGITVTPARGRASTGSCPCPIAWSIPSGTISIRRPWSGCRSPATDDQPLQLLVEYAYCFVDFQCFFGEEELTVATAAP